jgi:hypothetical protein
MGITGGLSRAAVIVLVTSAVAALSGCGSEEKAPAPIAQPTATETSAPAASTLAANDQTWTPEALEELLAPIALFPDPILSQIFMVSANPQEVLDSGNWLVQNPTLEGKTLDAAAEQAGFSPPMRALIQFPQVVDLMCTKMGWTSELGQAFANDEPGVLDAVQRLRKQAIEAGNLKTTEQMTVDTQVQDGKEVVLLKPPSKDVVYVPQYDPVAVYAPPPAAVTQPTTVVEKDEGFSTTALVATGLLSFGAGMLVNEVFFGDDDDDDHHHYNNNYYPNYGYGSMPPYPPYPYNPHYGNGYRPAHAYNRPPNYTRNNNNVVVVNQNNNYWNRYGNKPANQARGYTPKSPITSAKPNRPELSELNKKTRPAAATQREDWKGQGTYAGARPASKDAKARLPEQTRSTPGVQGSYKGATPERARPPSATADRGYSKQASKSAPSAKSAPAERPTPKADKSHGSGGASRSKDTAISGSQRGKADTAASKRGRQSMPQGAKSKSGGKSQKTAGQKQR